VSAPSFALLAEEILCLCCKVSFTGGGVAWALLVDVADLPLLLAQVCLLPDLSSGADAEFFCTRMLFCLICGNCCCGLQGFISFILCTGSPGNIWLSCRLLWVTDHSIVIDTAWFLQFHTLPLKPLPGCCTEL